MRGYPPSGGGVSAFLGMVSVGIRRYPQVSVTLGISKYLIFCRIPAFCKCNLSLFIILIKWNGEFHTKKRDVPVATFSCIEAV